jgi:hypothetical protein
LHLASSYPIKNTQIYQQFACGWQPTERNLHPAGRQLDENFAKIRT